MFQKAILFAGHSFQSGSIAVMILSSEKESVDVWYVGAKKKVRCAESEIGARPYWRSVSSSSFRPSAMLLLR